MDTLILKKHIVSCKYTRFAHLFLSIASAIDNLKISPALG